MNTPTYHITRNPLGRKILVINHYLDVDNDQQIDTDDFDVIYINANNLSTSEMGLLLEKTSPLFSIKCWMKPRFVQIQNTAKLRDIMPLIDGIAHSITDEHIAQRTEEIYQQIDRLHIVQASNISTYVSFFIRLCKYSISRGQYFYTSTIIPGLSEGHSALYTALLSNHEMVTRKDFLEFNHKLQDLGYAEPKAFVERVHLCPKCKSSHLIYAECCPKCNSSNIKDEPMIHHFRCANISPESTYTYDDQLRCPKCRQFLHHIGVDYDRPTDVNTCGECGHTFIHTDMKVRCASCNSIYTPQKLQPADVIRYQYTTKGIEAIIKNDALIKIGKDLWFGYSNFDSYLMQLRLFSHTSIHDEVLYTVRFHMPNSASFTKSDKTIILQRIHEIFYNYNFSYRGEYYFLSNKILAESANNQVVFDTEIRKKLEIVKMEFPILTVDKYSVFIRDINENIETYIRRICDIYQNPNE